MTDFKKYKYNELYQQAKAMYDISFDIPGKQKKQYYIDILNEVSIPLKRNKKDLIDIIINPHKYEVKEQKISQPTVTAYSLFVNDNKVKIKKDLSPHFKGKELNSEISRRLKEQWETYKIRGIKGATQRDGKGFFEYTSKGKQYFDLADKKLPQIRRKFDANEKKELYKELKNVSGKDLVKRAIKTKVQLSSVKTQLGISYNDTRITTGMKNKLVGKRLLSTTEMSNKKFNIKTTTYTIHGDSYIDFILPDNIPNYYIQTKFKAKFTDGSESDEIIIHNGQTLFEVIESLQQSEGRNFTKSIIKTIVLKQEIVNLAVGGNYTGQIPKTVDELRKKKSTVTLKNNADDNKFLCFDMSCTILNNIETRTTNRVWWSNLIRDNKRKNTILSIKLRKELGRPLDIPVGMEDYPIYEKHFQARFRIFQLDTINTHVIYETPINEETKEYTKKFNFIYYDKHYEPITTLNAFLGVSAVDENTLQTKLNAEKCTYCKSYTCDQAKIFKKTVPTLECKDCNRWFPTETCFQSHKIETCSTLKKCLECKTVYKVDPECKHICNVSECMNCHELVDLNTHKCFIKSNEKKLRPIKYNGVLVKDNNRLKEIYFEMRNKKIGFFDFESIVNEEGMHTVNMAVSYYYNKFDEPAFIGKDIKSFVEWVFSNKHNGFIFYAHNSGKYDTKLILEDLLSYSGVNLDEMPQVLKANGRILSLVYNNVKICDTYCHFMSSLKKLPSTFGFANEVKKGDFPHKFNTLENQNYVGLYPDESYYGLDQKSEEEGDDIREFLLLKYKNEEVFNFQEELLSYCKDDVKILLKAWKIYRELLFDLLKIDVCDFLTLASTAQAIHRQKFMPKKSIAISCKPYKNPKLLGEIEEYLMYMELKGGMKLERDYCLTIPCSNQIFNKLYVHGYNPNTRTVYEYLDCHADGCTFCYPNEIDISSGTHYEHKYKETLEKHYKLRKLGYNIESMWKHEFNNKKQTCQDLQEMLYDFQKKKPINTRDSFFGGRTDCKKLYYEAKENEKIRYLDFTSLYPFVQKYKEFPIGHPTIYKDDFKQLGYNFTEIVNNTFGIIKCLVSCPKSNEIQVLPLRDTSLGKLIFPAYDEMIGTWTSLELQTFIKQGGKILNIYEVHNFQNKSDNLFKEYVNFFLKIKQESSGYPLWVKNEEQKDEYIEKYQKKEGIKLEKEKIMKNAGLRALSKLYLNSLWGRYGMNEERDQTFFINEPSEFFKELSDKNSDVEFEVIGKNDNEFILMTKKNVTIKNTYSTSDYVAAFTTAHARLCLFNLMYDVGFKNVIYHDTDSVIYIEREMNKNIYKDRQGDYLGELTDEVEPIVSSDKEYISEVVALAPKTYSVKIVRHLQGHYQRNKDTGEMEEIGYVEEIITKSKGFTLNVENAREFNHDTMKNMLFEAIHNKNKDIVIKTKQFTIKQVNHGLGLESIITDKEMKFSYNKQLIGNDENDIYNLLPLGFKL